MKFEMHMHTSEVSPCSKRSAIEGIKDYKEVGYDGVVITDHLLGLAEKDNFSV